MDFIYAGIMEEEFVDKQNIIHRYPQEFTREKVAKREINVNRATTTSSFKVKTLKSKTTTEELINATNRGV